MATAFALTVSLAPPTSTFTGTQFSSACPTTARFAPRMALQTAEKPKIKSSFSRLESNRAAKIESEYRGPQGFTPYAEKVNGRLAQMGFVIGLVTEIVSGKPIGQQMLIMFSPLTQPLTHALQSVLSIMGN